MTSTHQTNLDQRWLQLRKERGTTACLEKAQSVEAVYGVAGQGKTCMVKAILPEPQFAATYTASGVAQRLTRHTGRKGRIQFRLPSGRTHPVEASDISACPAHPPYGGESERTGHLSTSNLLIRVITGWPTAGAGLDRRPVWPRSRHSTQMPCVTTGTVAFGRTDHRHKSRATGMKLDRSGGRTAASTIEQSLTEVC